ncbi:MAG: hypothetical protein ACK5T0_05455 [Vampirovibrionales bacterium]|jgi:hypothetical protein
MFPRDFVMTHTGLSSRVIDRFEKVCAFKVKKIRGAKYYDISQLITFRLIAFLKAEGIRLNNIEYASKYLQKLKPEESLSSLCLFHDGTNIIDLMNDPPLILNKEGQTVLREVKGASCVAVGGVLSETKRNVTQAITNLQEQRDTALEDCKPVSVDNLIKRLRA